MRSHCFALTGNAANNEKYARVICEIVVYPGERARGICCKARGARIGGEVVFDANLASLVIIIADQPIVCLVVMLQPERRCVPILHLVRLIVDRKIMYGEQ